MWCSSYFQRNAVSKYSSEILTSTCTFPFQNLSSCYIVGIRSFSLALVRNTEKKFLKIIKTELLPRSPYYNPNTYTSCEYLKFWTTSHLTIIREHIQITLQISAGLAIQLVLTKDIDRAMAVFSLGSSKARKIFCTTEQKS